MHSTFATLLDRLREPDLMRSGVIPWASPIPAFGDVSNAALATVGLNPSNREFMDQAGDELEGTARRFHTLSSLQLSDWSEADARHIRLMLDSCTLYFSRNPYDAWFRRLDDVVSATSFSLYGSGACHLDLIPYATSAKWTNLTAKQRAALLALTADALALLLSDSQIRILVLNGHSVVRNFQQIAGDKLIKIDMRSWALARRGGQHVHGFAYRGVVEQLAGLSFAQPVLVLGYNHNIQSSYGVSSDVVERIGRWVAAEVRSYLSK
jgi:hypothetical protein